MKKVIIFYDGYCVLCNFWVRKVCLWDRSDRLRFAPLDSPLADEMFKKTGFDSSKLDSVLVWDQQSNPLVESAGVYRVLKILGGFWRLVFIFKLVPIKFQNWIYRYIAKRRYRWFGKNKTCPIPEVDIRHKFL